MKLILLIALTAGVFAQSNQKPESQSECPMHATHTQMNERGEKGMGFPQTATTHHFLLNSNGGVIQVEAKDSADATNRNEIRRHLGHIAKAFQSGDSMFRCLFTIPFRPGVPEMNGLRKIFNIRSRKLRRGDALLFRLRTKRPLKPSIDSCDFKFRNTRLTTRWMSDKDRELPKFWMGDSGAHLGNTVRQCPARTLRTYSFPLGRLVPKLRLSLLPPKDRARIGLGFDSHLPVQVPLHQRRELTYYA